MQYLVVAENTQYYHWQLSLLIESFKKHNLQNDLCIFLVDSNEKTNERFSKNLIEHQNKNIFENIGKTRGFDKLNKLYGMLWAIESNKIKQPFALIPADVILEKPINLDLHEYPEIYFNPDKDFNFNYVKNSVPNLLEILNRENKKIEDYWISIGPVIVFNNMPIDFFRMFVVKAEILALKQLIYNQKIFDKTDRLALSINIFDFMNKGAIKEDYNLTKSMLEYNETSFIHYEHGMPPVFNKSMFRYDPPDYASFGDPYEAILENPATPSAYLMSELVKNIIEKK
jgi:hypothetical protein